MNQDRTFGLPLDMRARRHLRFGISRLMLASLLSCTMRWRELDIVFDF